MYNLSIYISDAEKRQKIEALAKSMRLSVRQISYEELDQTVGSVAQTPVSLPQKAVSIPPLYVMPDFILFAGLSSQQLDQFLDGYKKASIEKVALKAILTPYNIGWSLYELIEHLKQESRL